MARWCMPAMPAVERGHQACQGGDAASCQLLGWEYKQGSRVPLDLDRSQRLYARSCEGGSALACFFAGTLREGGGQRLHARDYYRRACQGGAAAGCTSLKRLDGQLR